MKRLMGVAAIGLIAILMASVALAQQSSTTSESDAAPAAFITLNLEAGYPLDPFLVSVNGGGDVEASTLAPTCNGYITADPTVSLNWSGEADFVEAFFHSNHDPVLVVQLPSGEYLCNDDANRLILDAVVEIDDPQNGRYNIWVGSHHAQQLLPGVLVLTTRPEINVGTFAPGDLIDRRSIPEELVQLRHHQDEAGTLLAQLGEAIEAMAALEAGGETIVQELTAEGEVPAFELPTGHLSCVGFVNETPDYSFEWSGEADSLRLYFEGDDDATLIVHTPDGSFLCNDDAAGQGTLNPMVEIPNPEAGTYSVLIGRVDPAQAVSGNLTITEATDLMPAILEAAGE